MINLNYYNQGKTVDMKVVEYITTRPHKGRRSHPAIPSGTKVYLLAYDHPKGGYYTYSYMNREDAEKCIEGGKLYRTNNEYYMEWNRTFDPELTLHY